MMAGPYWAKNAAPERLIALAVPDWSGKTGGFLKLPKIVVPKRYNTAFFNGIHTRMSNGK